MNKYMMERQKREEELDTQWRCQVREKAEAGMLPLPSRDGGMYGSLELVQMLPGCETPSSGQRCRPKVRKVFLSGLDLLEGPPLSEMPPVALLIYVCGPCCCPNASGQIRGAAGGN